MVLSSGGHMKRRASSSLPRLRRIIDAISSRGRVQLLTPEEQRKRKMSALRADGVPGNFVRLLDDINQRITAAVRTPARCTTPFVVVTGVRQGAMAGPFLFNFVIDDIMLRAVVHFPADLEHADVVIFAESATKRYETRRTTN
ncbi:hypothetical protein RB195_025218 [Necator americanus]|uniref:Reverse transcriptase domain-containing protein n=1 Tax=Necator americanus TaxID=51031 RepID=A0ABR1ERC5_NECAM